MAGSFILCYNCCGSPLLSETILTVSSGSSKATERGYLSVLHSHLMQRGLKPRPSTRQHLETWQASHPTGMFYMATFGKLSMGSRVLVTNALLTHSFVQHFMLGSNYVITVISGIVFRCCGFRTLAYWSVWPMFCLTPPKVQGSIITERAHWIGYSLSVLYDSLASRRGCLVNQAGQSI